MSDRVERNGVVAYRPQWMDKTYWDEYEAPRIGKRYGKFLYGEQFDTPSYGSPEDEDGCGGACTI